LPLDSDQLPGTVAEKTTPKPRVSVIVPLYNKALCIRRCLDSISKQRVHDLEAIIVDDGSKDGGAEIARQYGDPRFRVLSQANAGPGAARNYGISHARGDLIAFLDADDVWLPEFLETNLAIMDRHPSVAAVSGCWLECPGEVPCADTWSARGIREGILQVSPATPVRSLAAVIPFMSPCATVVRAQALRQSGGFQGAGCYFGEDGALWLKLLMKHPVYLHLGALTEVHQEDSDLSGRYTGPRPIEPFLSHPDTFRAACQPELIPLLERFYARRACKTACMLGYWGQWRAAAALVRRFVSLRDWRAPQFVPALVASTPLGAVAAWAWRNVGYPPAQVAAPRRNQSLRA
jgi:hypothetical protein